MVLERYGSLLRNSLLGGTEGGRRFSLSARELSGATRSSRKLRAEKLCMFVQRASWRWELLELSRVPCSTVGDSC